MALIMNIILWLSMLANAKNKERMARKRKEKAYTRATGKRKGYKRCTDS